MRGTAGEHALCGQAGCSLTAVRDAWRLRQITDDHCRDAVRILCNDELAELKSPTPLVPTAGSNAQLTTIPPQAHPTLRGSVDKSDWIIGLKDDHFGAIAASRIAA